MFIKKELKILFLVSSLNQGGLETYLLRFLRHTGLSNSHVLCKSGTLGDLYNEYKLVTDCVVPMKLGYINLIKWTKLYLYMRKNEFTAICDFTGNFAGIPLWIAFWAGIEKRITFYRGSDNHFRETFLRVKYNDFVKWITFRYATKILSNSQVALDYFYPMINRSSSRFKVIYNGVNVSEFTKADKNSLLNEFEIPAGAFVVGHTGRLNYAKNHKTIIEVAIRLCSVHKDIYFILAGKGVDEAYQKEIEKLQLQSQIRLLGYRNDVNRLLNLFDLFYFPSLTEGQPNSLIEAMIFGLPIVASNIPSIQESVPEHMLEMLVEPCDVNKASALIERYYHDRQSMELIRCRRWAELHFDAGILFGQFKNELL